MGDLVRLRSTEQGHQRPVRGYRNRPARVQESLGRHGLLYVGDGKMASRATRACLASQGDFYLCPLPALQLAEDELAQALEALWSGQQTLTPVYLPDGHNFHFIGSWGMLGP